MKRRDLLGFLVTALITTFSGCSSLFSEPCDRLGSLQFERERPPTDLEPEIAPVEYAPLTSDEQSLVDAGLSEESVEVCLSESSDRSAAFGRFADRVRGSLSEQEEEQILDVYLLKSDVLYEIRLVIDGTPVTT